MRLKSSSARWLAEPITEVAKLMSFGCERASRTNSASDFTGSAGLAISTSGPFATWLIGVKSSSAR